jgi:ribosomal protein S18 acetylase RimI-like enzyme
MIDPAPATDVVVRPMREADVATVAAIETETFSSPWREDTFAGLLDRPGVELLVLESSAAGVIGSGRRRLESARIRPKRRPAGGVRLHSQRKIDGGRARGPCDLARRSPT